MDNLRRKMTGFAYVMKERGITTSQLSEMLSDEMNKETIRRYVVGVNHPTNGKYDNVKKISRAMGFTNTDDFIDEILKYESETGQNDFERRNHNLRKIEDILANSKQIGYLPMEDCMELCKHARIKRQYVRVGRESKPIILRQAVEKLNVKTEMEKIGMKKLIDFDGNVIVE